MAAAPPETDAALGCDALPWCLAVMVCRGAWLCGCWPSLPPAAITLTRRALGFLYTSLLSHLTSPQVGPPDFIVNGETRLDPITHRAVTFHAANRSVLTNEAQLFIACEVKARAACSVHCGHTRVAHTWLIHVAHTRGAYT